MCELSGLLILVLKFLVMFVPSNVANGDPLFLTMWWRPGQIRGPLMLGFASQHKYSLHERVPVGMKLLP